MRENEIARQIVDAAYTVHTRLGPGLLESVYELVLEYELQERGLDVRRQVSLPVIYGNLRVEGGYIVDLIVNDTVLVELKSVEQLAKLHQKQLLTYLHLADKRLGLLINFGGALIADNIRRIANEMEE